MELSERTNTRIIPTVRQIKAHVAEGGCFYCLFLGLPMTVGCLEG